MKNDNLLTRDNESYNHNVGQARRLSYDVEWGHWATPERMTLNGRY